jgi:hypothetical protein
MHGLPNLLFHYNWAIKEEKQEQGNKLDTTSTNQLQEL